MAGRALLSAWLGVALLGAAARAGAEASPAAWLRAEPVQRIPFDRGTFTEGLAAAGEGRLLVSAGLWGRSGLRVVDAETGRELARRANEARAFGEGVAVLEGRGLAVQLTYRGGYAVVYNATTLVPLRRAALPAHGGPREGWGLASGPDGELYATDGTSNVYVMGLHRGGGLQLLRTLRTPVTGLNELEFVNGSLVANVYMTDCLVRLSPEDGRVEARIDAAGLWPENPHPAVYVLNGVAEGPPGQLYLAGKMWPHMVRARLVPADAPFRCPRARMTVEDSVLSSVLAMGGDAEDVEGFGGGGGGGGGGGMGLLRSMQRGDLR